MQSLMRPAFRRAIGASAGLALLAGLALAGCGRGAARPAPRDGAPNVLLVSIDTLRADRVGAYGAGFGATPTLDALAAGGLRAEKAFSPVPITLPAHATLLTGLYPPRHGVRHNGIFRLGAEQVTLAERFRDAGYATGAVVGAMVLERRFGLDQGFDHYDDAFGSDRATSTGYLERPAGAVTAAALDWLADVRGPFFLFVHYYDPHADYAPPPEFAARFPGRPYEGEIAAVDAAIAELLAGLEARGSRAQTIVAITADHGESLGEHGERTHSYTLYDATLSVPLLLAGPGVPPGRTLPGVTSIASVAPTLLRLAGLPPLEAPDGEDLLARAAGPPAGGEAYAETLATQLDHGWAPLYALRTPEYHFVRAPRAELYRVQQDPREQRNLLAEGARPEAQALDAALAAHLARGAPLRTEPVDAETKQRLRSLGYALADEPVAETGLDPKDGLRLVEVYVDARTAFYAGDLEKAERRAREILAESPGSGQTHMLLSSIARRRGDLRQALAEVERAAVLLPVSAAFHSEIGDLRLELGDLPGALAAYDAALAVDPEFAEAHAGSMWRAALAKDPGLAETAAARAVAIRPADALLRLRVAQAFDRLGDGARALEAFRETLRLDPGSQAAHMGVAIQLARLGEDAEVEQQLAAAGPYASEPNHRNRLAIAYAGRGENERAEALFRDVLAAQPAHPNARRNLGHLLRTTGRGAEAEALEAGGAAKSAKSG
jgi:arylsulfatase A-like enzyme/Tfp pilus assembly protein PilF